MDENVVIFGSVMEGESNSEFDDEGEEEERQLFCECVLHARSVSCVSCGDDGALMISTWLRGKPVECKIKKLSLTRKRGSAMSEVGAAALADMLATNMSLVELDLGNNRIGAKGATRLAEALRTNTTLRSLDLTGPPLPFARTSTLTSNGLLRVGLEGARALAEVIGQGQCVLESLSLGRNGLGEDGLAVLCEGLQRSSRLRGLDVSCNNLGDESLPCLEGLLLAPSCALRVLDLTTNRLTAQGAAHLARLVAASTSLRVLCVDECMDEEEEGMAALRQAVQTSYALEEMDCKCKVAFCMSQHPRLGASSPANGLDEETCAAIVALMKVPVQRRLLTAPAENMYRMTITTN